MPEGSASAAGGETLDALFAGGRPEHTAFVVPDDGHTVSYAEMAERIETLAGRLAAAGVRRGDRVALTLPNGPDFVLLLLAITAPRRRGRTAQPGLHRDRVHVLPEDMAPRLLLMPAGMPAAAAAAAAATGTAVLGVADGADGPPDLLRDGEPVDGRAGFRARHARRRGGRPAHQRHDQPAEAGSAAPAQPDGLDPHDRRALPARPGRRLVLRDAAVPHPRPGRLHVRRAGSRRRGDRAAPVHPAAVLAAGPRARATWLSAGPTLHQMMLDKADDGGRRRTRCGSSARAARRCRPRCWSGPRAATACRCWRPTG